jgi:predicted O-methyltransferase YrrM
VKQNILKATKRVISKSILAAGAPLTYISSIWLKIVVKKATVSNIGNKIFMKLGVLPVLDHYYQPMINPEKHLRKSLREDRKLTGINFNTKEQLELLAKFKYNNELLSFPVDKNNESGFYYNNASYESGDAEYLYNMVRHFKPKRIIEIGSGNSTLMVRNAISQNKIDHPDYNCRHICIEPYEQPWLEGLGIEVIREKVECIEVSFFEQLESNDILFIDSSHIIRPQGDVLFEYLELIPTLKSGVLIHIHDIFSPRDYKDEWIFSHLLWNEQYLLEAFLTFNSEFKVIAALNFLTHNHREELASKCPIFAVQVGREPGAFWIQRN